jgi:hypothetical protein
VALKRPQPNAVITVTAVKPTVVHQDDVRSFPAIRGQWWASNGVDLPQGAARPRRATQRSAVTAPEPAVDFFFLAPFDKAQSGISDAQSSMRVSRRERVCWGVFGPSKRGRRPRFPAGGRDCTGCPVNACITQAALALNHLRRRNVKERRADKNPPQPICLWHNLATTALAQITPR